MSEPQPTVTVTRARNAKTTKCRHCGCQFQCERSSAKFCSVRCRVASLRKTRKIKVYFRSDTDEWATPPGLFAELDREFGFQLDVCASPGNAKCGRYFTREDDGLQQEWVGVCWMNPPYGRTIGQWILKALEASRNGATVVCLVPARTDTRWWQDYVTQAADVRFIRGRLKFGGAANGAPFPSAVVVFGCATKEKQS